jgi:hypothetical protein
MQQTQLELLGAVVEIVMEGPLQQVVLGDIQLESRLILFHQIFFQQQILEGLKRREV